MRLYIIALISLLFAGCETTIPVDLPDQEPKIVVNSLFAPDKLEWIISVVGSKGMYDNTLFTPIRDANVNLYKDGVHLETVNYSDAMEGFRVLQDNLPVQGATYTIKVDAAGMESVEATETVPLPIQINSITINKNVRKNKDSGSFESDVVINFNDPEGEANYYGLKVNLLHFGNLMEGANFKSADVAFSQSGYSYDETDNYRYFCCEKVLFSDEYFDGKSYNLTITMEEFEIQNSNEIQIELYTVNRSFYLYKKSMQLQIDSKGNPFAEPVIIFNNIKNGFGIFSTYSKDIEKKPI